MNKYYIPPTKDRCASWIAGYYMRRDLDGSTINSEAAQVFCETHRLRYNDDASYTSEQLKGMLKRKLMRNPRRGLYAIFFNIHRKLDEKEEARKVDLSDAGPLEPEYGVPVKRRGRRRKANPDQGELFN